MRNYFRFTGRSSREDYFKFRLFNTFVKFLSLFTIINLISISLDHFYSRYIQELPANLPTSIKWLAFILLLCIISRLILSIRLYSLTVRRLHDLNRTGWWYLLVLIPRYLCNLFWILFIGFSLYGFIIMFGDIKAANNISPAVIANGFNAITCCPPFLSFNIEAMFNGGIKMWLYLLFWPMAIVYYLTNPLMVILLSSKSNSENNRFGFRKLSKNSKDSFIYVASLFAEMIYTIFFICFVLFNWYKIINGFADIAAANNITHNILYPLFDVFSMPSLKIFFYVTMGLIILNTLFFRIYFRYSK